MIRYTLECDKDHVFESWFQSADRFDELSARGHISCPDCGSAKVAKSLMAPPVKSSKGDGDAALATTREKALAELRAHVEANSDYVGMNFATEARSMWLGDTPQRSIYGEAKPDDARALIEDGVPVAPLPFVPRAKSN